jgi:RHS repeat-associated protein
LCAVSDTPATIAPGEAFVVRTDNGGQLTVPDSSLRVHYYHQDHLGSSSYVSDAKGSPIDEIAFYPFGIPRNEYELRNLEENYGYTQKERDNESGLQYFEARHLAANLARFSTVDPLYAALVLPRKDRLARYMADPQMQNLYAYALNRPTVLNDPSGMDSKATIDRFVTEANQSLSNQGGVATNYRFVNRELPSRTGYEQGEKVLEGPEPQEGNERRVYGSSRNLWV